MTCCVGGATVLRGKDDWVVCGVRHRSIQIGQVPQRPEPPSNVRAQPILGEPQCLSAIPRLDPFDGRAAARVSPPPETNRKRAAPAFPTFRTARDPMTRRLRTHAVHAKGLNLRGFGSKSRAVHVPFKGDARAMGHPPHPAFQQVDCSAPIGLDAMVAY